MLDTIKPIKAESLKDICIKRFEELILSGRLPVGEKMPPERELAVQLGVSRPVIHEALVDIAAKGMVSMIPRVGTIVNDYRREGSVAMLTSLISYHNGRLEPKLLDSLLAMRLLFEKENARLAAVHRTRQQMEEFYETIKQEEAVDHDDIDLITEIDFNFHHLIAMATDNVSYPMLLNSFRPVYTSLSGQFFEVPEVVPEVFAFHREMVDALEVKDEQASVDIMHRMLVHGEDRLKDIISTQGGGYEHDPTKTGRSEN